MSELSLFGNKSNAALALLGDVEDTLTSTIAGGGGGNRRISIEGGVFREFIGGKEVRVSEERSMNVVLVNAAPVSRMFFEGVYQKGKVTKPTCWSSDSQRPDNAVPAEQRQASMCKDCPQHVKGSAPSGEGRACRFQQRIAVVLESEIGKEIVHQITLPSTSVFGDAEGKKMPLQAYGRYLKAHNTHAISIVTEMRFDIDSSTPKLVFKPVRALEEDELRAVITMRDHPDTVKAVTLNVSQMDGVIPAPKAAPAEEPAPKAAPKPKAEKVQAEEVEEPVKVTKKAAAPEPKSEIADIVGDWDDE
jgi:hypothetical protein